MLPHPIERTIICPLCAHVQLWDDYDLGINQQVSCRERERLLGHSWRTGFKSQWSVQKKIVTYIEQLAAVKGVTARQAIVVIQGLGIPTRNQLFDWIGRKGHLLLNVSASPSELHHVSRRRPAK